MDEASWDERYRLAGGLWSGHPNPQLVREAADLAPGVALDVACGEGADAIWLAQHGWRVTAVDFSRVALDRGAARAADLGDAVAGRITWLHADLTEWEPPASAYDLVSAQFVHLPKDRRESLYHRLAAAVMLHGALLVVGHALSDLGTSVGRPTAPDHYFAASDITSWLPAAQWTTIVDEERPRGVDGPDGEPVLVHDCVLRVQRTS